MKGSIPSLVVVAADSACIPKVACPGKAHLPRFHEVQMVTRLCEAVVGNWSPVQMAWVVAAVMDVKGTLGDHSVVVVGIGLFAMVNMDITGAF